MNILTVKAPNLLLMLGLLLLAAISCGPAPARPLVAIPETVENEVISLADQSPTPTSESEPTLTSLPSPIMPSITPTSLSEPTLTLLPSPTLGPPTFTPSYTDTQILAESLLPTTGPAIPTTTGNEPRPQRATSTPLPTIAPASNEYAFSAQNLTFTLERERSLAVPYIFNHVSWSPKEEGLFAFTYWTGGWLVENGWEETEIAVIDVEGRQLQRLALGFEPLFSPDGERIAYLEYSAKNGKLDQLYIKIIELESQEITLATTVFRDGVYPLLAWLSNTELLFYEAGQENSVMLFDYESGQKIDLFSLAQSELSFDSSSPLQLVATAPQHGYIAVGSAQLLAILERNESGLYLLQKFDEGTPYRQMAFSPDGRSFAYVGYNQELRIMAVGEQRQMIELPPEVDGEPSTLAWSPDSASLIYDEFEGLWIVNRDGSGLRKILDFDEDRNLVFWSPQGQHLLLADEPGPMQRVTVSSKLLDPSPVPQEGSSIFLPLLQRAQGDQGTAMAQDTTTVSYYEEGLQPDCGIPPTNIRVHLVSFLNDWIEQGEEPPEYQSVPMEDYVHGVLMGELGTTVPDRNYSGEEWHDEALLSHERTVHTTVKTLCLMVRVASQMWLQTKSIVPFTLIF